MFTILMFVLIFSLCYIFHLVVSEQDVSYREGHGDRVFMRNLSKPKEPPSCLKGYFYQDKRCYYVWDTTKDSPSLLEDADTACKSINENNEVSAIRFSEMVSKSIMNFPYPSAFRVQVCCEKCLCYSHSSTRIEVDYCPCDTPGYPLCSYPVEPYPEEEKIPDDSSEAKISRDMNPDSIENYKPDYQETYKKPIGGDYGASGALETTPDHEKDEFSSYCDTHPPEETNWDEFPKDEASLEFMKSLFERNDNPPLGKYDDYEVTSEYIKKLMNFENPTCKEDYIYYNGACYYTWRGGEHPLTPITREEKECKRLSEDNEVVVFPDLYILHFISNKYMYQSGNFIRVKVDEDTCLCFQLNIERGVIETKCDCKNTWAHPLCAYKVGHQSPFDLNYDVWAEQRRIDNLPVQEEDFLIDKERLEVFWEGKERLDEGVKCFDGAKGDLCNERDDSNGAKCTPGFHGLDCGEHDEELFSP